MPHVTSDNATLAAVRAFAARWHVGAHDGIRVEHPDQCPEIAIAAGGKKGVGDPALTADVDV